MSRNQGMKTESNKNVSLTTNVTDYITDKKRVTQRSKVVFPTYKRLEAKMIIFISLPHLLNSEQQEQPQLPSDKASKMY